MFLCTSNRQVARLHSNSMNDKLISKYSCFILMISCLGETEWMHWDDFHWKILVTKCKLNPFSAHADFEK